MKGVAGIVPPPGGGGGGVPPGGITPGVGGVPGIGGGVKGTPRKVQEIGVVSAPNPAPKPGNTPVPGAGGVPAGAAPPGVNIGFTKGVPSGFSPSAGGGLDMFKVSSEAAVVSTEGFGGGAVSNRFGSMLRPSNR